MRKQYAAAKWNIAHLLDDVSLRRSLICKTFLLGEENPILPDFSPSKHFRPIWKSHPARKRGGTSKKSLPPQANGATGL